jgi:hypothetical protein
MPRTPAKTTQADIARALRAIEQTGAQMIIEITPDGIIRLIPVDHRLPEDACLSTVERHKEIIL